MNSCKGNSLLNMACKNKLIFQGEYTRAYFGGSLKKVKGWGGLEVEADARLLGLRPHKKIGSRERGGKGRGEDAG